MTSNKVNAPVWGSHVTGLGSAVLGSLMTGFGGIFASLTYGMSGVILACWRTWLGASFLLLLLLSTGRRLHRGTVRSSLWPAFFLSADFVTFFCAIKLTSVVDAAILGALQPLLVMIFARQIFSERLQRFDVLWIVLAACGVSIAVLGPGTHGPHALAGNLCAIAAVFMWTGYWLAVKRSRQDHDALEFTASVLLVSSLLVVPVWLLSGESIFHSRATDWHWILLLAVIPSTGHLVLNYAQRFLSASISSAIGCLNPLVASVAAVPILHQKLGPTQIVGVALGVAAVTAVALARREPSLAADP